MKKRPLTIALRIILYLVLGTIGALAGKSLAQGASVPPHYRVHHRVLDPAGMQAGLAAAIHADVAASAWDPVLGKNVFVMGDALTIGGVDQTKTGFFPRNEFVTQVPGSNVFTVLPGPYGPKDQNGHTWQQVPGQANGNFWPSGILLDGSSIWLFGNAVTGLQTVGDAEVAQFSASTLTYEGVTDLNIGSETWGSSTPAAGGGFWVTGTQNVCGNVNNCKQGDLAFIPQGGESFPASWTVTDNVFPASLNVGTIISPVPNGTGDIAYTKRGDAFGDTSIEELSAPTMLGPWTTTGRTWPTNPPAGDYSYDVQVQLKEGEPAGTRLLTYAMNGNPADYYVRFFTVTYGG